MYFNFDPSTPVLLNDGDFTVGDYPIHHIAALLAGYEGQIAHVVERLECDGWTPHDIVKGAAR